MSEQTVGRLLRQYLAKRGIGPKYYGSLSRRAGLSPGHVAKIVSGSTRPELGTLLKIADAERFTDDERAALEMASGGALPPGSLKKTLATRYPSVEEEREMNNGKRPRLRFSERRAFLLLTGPRDPSRVPRTLAKTHDSYADVAWRAGVVFGPYDAIVRVTTPEGVSVLDYAEDLYRLGEDEVRTVETIPLRDGMPAIYLDKQFSTQHLKKRGYRWATIFLQDLGGERSREYTEIFYEVSEDREFRGALHLLTAAVTVSQYDSVVEVLVANLDVLQKYVRDAQRHAWEEYGRRVHTITYFATEIQRQEHALEF